MRILLFHDPPLTMFAIFSTMVGITRARMAVLTSVTIARSGVAINGKPIPTVPCTIAANPQIMNKSNEVKYSSIWSILFLRVHYLYSFAFPLAEVTSEQVDTLGLR